MYDLVHLLSSIKQKLLPFSTICLEIQLGKPLSDNCFIFSLFQPFISKNEEQKKTFITIMGELVPLDDILQEKTKVK